MLRRVGEDLELAEGVVRGKVQAQTYARTFLEWEKEQKRANAEYHELMQIEYLLDERASRLGIALLLLLLAVLVFMTLTRGSRGEAVMVPSTVGYTISIKLDFPTTICTMSPPSTASKPKPPVANTILDGQRARSHTPPLTRTPHRRPETRAHARHATDDGVLHLAALACPAERAPLRAHGASARAARRCLWVGVCACAAARRGVIRWQPSGRLIASGPGVGPLTRLRRVADAERGTEC
ncbi:hypothetical protein C8R45DRAFT_1087889 [Mycena sanguinolenta]|nr:hypothetical protein C8R45DRAFT_1087889 [Mycena sanguinolenta]